tara:strand:- start:249 stop:452 length:204 start_codon:yes stop_codon:yes gene_type:complete
MNMETLKLYCDEMISSFPQHKEEIVDYLQLAIDEIEQGASEPNEIKPMCRSYRRNVCSVYGRLLINI